jgi:hypothetical protein
MTNKPWLKKNTEEVIDVMGAKITLKKMSFGESRKAISQGMTFDMETGKPTVDPSLVGVMRAISQIKDWELTDEQDNKLPITLDTFDNVLDEEFAGAVVDAITKRDAGNVTDKEKK